MPFDCSNTPVLSVVVVVVVVVVVIVVVYNTISDRYTHAAKQTIKSQLLLYVITLYA